MQPQGGSRCCSSGIPVSGMEGAAHCFAACLPGFFLVDLCQSQGIPTSAPATNTPVRQESSVRARLGGVTVSRDQELEPT